MTADLRRNRQGQFLKKIFDLGKLGPLTAQYVSARFVRKHKRIVDMLKRSVSSGPFNGVDVGHSTCQWTLRFGDEKGAFLAKKRRSPTSIKFMGLVTTKDKSHVDFSGLNHVYDGPELLEACANLRGQFCYLGSQRSSECQANLDV